MKLWFGQHKNKELEDLPTDYLTTLRTLEVPPKGNKSRADFLDLLDEVEEILALRAEEGEERE